MNWGKHNECYFSINHRIRFHFILNQGSVYLAFLKLRLSLVWKWNEGKTLISL